MNFFEKLEEARRILFCNHLEQLVHSLKRESFEMLSKDVFRRDNDRATHFVLAFLIGIEFVESDLSDSSPKLLIYFEFFANFNYCIDQ